MNRDPQPGRMPSRLRFTCLLVDTEQGYDRIALYLQKQFAEIGVDMQIQPVSIKDFGARVNSGQFDAFLMELVSARSLTWTYTFGTLAARSSTPAIRLPTGPSTACASPRATTRPAPPSPSCTGLLRRSAGDLHRLPEAAQAVRSTFEVPADSNPDVMGTLWRWTPSTVLMRASR